MSKAFFYDDQGTAHGPFPVQDDGYPDAGSVVRYFREKHNIRGSTLAKQLGCSSQRVSYMEVNNYVPLDIKRRHVLAALLGIPLPFFGLSDAPRSSIDAKLPIDLTVPKTLLPTLWLSFHSGQNLHDLRPSMTLMMQQLDGAQDVAALVLKAKYLRLYSLMLRDQRMMSGAIKSIELSEKIARELGDKGLLAVSLLTRARIAAEDDRPEESFTYNIEALSYEPLENTSVRATTMVEAAMALSQYARDEDDRDRVKSLMDDAGAIAYSKPDEDGSYTKMNPGLFQGYAGYAYNEMGEYQQARLALDQAKNLLPAFQTRRSAKIDIIQAKQALFGENDLDHGIDLLVQGYKVSRDLDSQYNLHTIRQINTSLMTGKWKHTPEVRNLQMVFA